MLEKRLTLYLKVTQNFLIAWIVQMLVDFKQHSSGCHA